MMANNTLRIRGKTYLSIPEGFEPGGWKWSVALADANDSIIIESPEVFDSREDALANMDAKVKELYEIIPKALGTTIDRKLEVIDGRLDS